jgi:hypothetical protein
MDPQAPFVLCYRLQIIKLKQQRIMLILIFIAVVLVPKGLRNSTLPIPYSKLSFLFLKRCVGRANNWDMKWKKEKIQKSHNMQERRFW